MTTMTEARDDIYTAFKTVWDAQAGVANGGEVPEVRWDGVQKTATPEEPPADKPWARVKVMHMTGGQITLGAVGNRRFLRAGTVFVQVFVPYTRGQGLSLGDQLVMIARAAFEGRARTAQGVTFRNARSREVGPTRSWYQYNVMSDFEYEEIK